MLAYTCSAPFFSLVCSSKVKVIKDDAWAKDDGSAAKCTYLSTSLTLFSANYVRMYIHNAMYVLCELRTSYAKHTQQQATILCHYTYVHAQHLHSGMHIHWSTLGGMAPAASTFLKRLAPMLAEKTDESYSL